MSTNDKIILRAPEPSDIDTLYFYENIHGQWRVSLQPLPVSRQQIHDYVTNYDGNIYATGQARFMIELQHADDTSTVVGTIDITDYDPRNRRGAVGIFIEPNYRHRGCATVALSLLMDYARQSIGAHQLWAVVASDNQHSLDLFRRQNFAVCGELRDWLVRDNAQYVNAYMLQYTF